MVQVTMWFKGSDWFPPSSLLPNGAPPLKKGGVFYWSIIFEDIV
jgi:hypothetical protein